MKEEKNCTTCKYFKSWREDFLGDPYEPDDCGLCLYDPVPCVGNPQLTDDSVPSVDFVCDNHEVSVE